MWYLAMNINPFDGHIMNYCKLWNETNSRGDEAKAFQEDFVDSIVRNMSVNKIAIVRHQNDIPDTVKVWRFMDKDMSLLSRFKKGKNYFATTGKEIFSDIRNATFAKDPIFSVSGDLVFNKEWGDNGVRISNSEVKTPQDGDILEDNMAGLGCKMARCSRDDLKYDVSIVNKHYDGSKNKRIFKVLGTDHGSNKKYREVEEYSNIRYAIVVSPTLTTFPHIPLRITMSLGSKLFYLCTTIIYVHCTLYIYV